jgi:two-component system, OmpR family, KDP operon response regulator KdpE
MTDVQPLILLIEDELPVHKFLGASLPVHGFRLLGAETGKDGLARAADYNPDVVLLDLGLPDMDGLEVTTRLREWSSVPIIVLSARGQEKDKIAALDAGADDYLTKPFSTGELIARIRVALRHTARLADNSPEPVFTMGDLRVDLAGRHVFVGDTEVHMTRMEYKLLTALVRCAGRVLTHQQLLKEVWGPHHPHDTHYLRVHMAQLRRKIEPDPAQPRYLLTETGVGYRFTAPPAEEGGTDPAGPRSVPSRQP